MKTDLFYEKGNWVLYCRDAEKVLAVFNTKPTSDQVMDVVYRAQTGESKRKTAEIDKLMGINND